jgi:hypothetical protein
MSSTFWQLSNLKAFGFADLWLSPVSAAMSCAAIFQSCVVSPPMAAHRGSAYPGGALHKLAALMAANFSSIP